MNKDKYAALKTFFDGVTSFVDIPTRERNTEIKRQGQPDISRHFQTVGRRISNAYERFEEDRK